MVAVQKKRGCCCLLLLVVLGAVQAALPIEQGLKILIPSLSSEEFVVM
jgi:hypothetical protein